VTQIPLFGQRVARIRQERRLSVQELATKAPSIVLAQRIARALGVGVDYLIGMFEEDEEESLSHKAAPVS
jgi:transcriptional regulator with XRE-family HTH domain